MLSLKISCSPLLATLPPPEGKGALPGGGKVDWIQNGIKLPIYCEIKTEQEISGHFLFPLDIPKNSKKIVSLD